MNPLVKTPDISKKPTHGQLDNRLLDLFSEDRRTNDRMLDIGHEKYSGLSEIGQGKLMGYIRCTWIPFILVMTNQSHLLPLSKPYSADPPVNLKTHIGTSAVKLFFVMILTTHYAYKPMFYV